MNDTHYVKLMHFYVAQAVTLEDDYYHKLLSIITSLDTEGNESVLLGVNQEAEEGGKGPARSNITHENLRGLLRLPLKDIYTVIDDLTEDHMAQRLILANKLNAKKLEYPPVVSLETFEAEVSGDPAMNIGSTVSTEEFERLIPFDRER